GIHQWVIGGQNCAARQSEDVGHVELFKRTDDGLGAGHAGGFDYLIGAWDGLRVRVGYSFLPLRRMRWPHRGGEISSGPHFSAPRSVVVCVVIAVDVVHVVGCVAVCGTHKKTPASAGLPARGSAHGGRFRRLTKSVHALVNNDY